MIDKLDTQRLSMQQVQVAVFVELAQNDEIEATIARETAHNANSRRGIVRRRRVIAAQEGLFVGRVVASACRSAACACRMVIMQIRHFLLFLFSILFFLCSSLKINKI